MRAEVGIHGGRGGYLCIPKPTTCLPIGGTGFIVDRGDHNVTTYCGDTCLSGHENHGFSLFTKPELNGRQIRRGRFRCAASCPSRSSRLAAFIGAFSCHPAQPMNHIRSHAFVLVGHFIGSVCSYSNSLIGPYLSSQEEAHNLQL